MASRFQLPRRITALPSGDKAMIITEQNHQPNKTNAAPQRGVNAQLEEEGWLKIDDVKSTEEFERLAEGLGRPIPDSRGRIVKQLVPIETATAPPRTFSSLHGKGSFPFHTDTASWPLPARLVLLRAAGGDLRRDSHVLPFRHVINSDLGLSQELVSQSIWLLGFRPRTHYSTMSFAYEGRGGNRFDPNFMRPANAAAKIVKPLFAQCALLLMSTISWKAGRVVVIDNWRCMHARGAPPLNEGVRLLERIYLS